MQEILTKTKKNKITLIVFFVLLSIFSNISKADVVESGEVSTDSPVVLDIPSVVLDDQIVVEPEVLTDTITVTTTTTTTDQSIDNSLEIISTTTEQSVDSSLNASTTSNTTPSPTFTGSNSDSVFDTVVNTIKDIVSDTIENISDLISPTLEDLDTSSTAPILFAEQDTETGKLVTISSPDEDPNNPHTNVLASTTIPEIYKVGEENKIQIKWKNEGGMEMPFNVYDIDNNGYLDYIEWTIPHLSTQIFQIIFISKAFHLDTDQSIIADIYDTVKAQDGNYASLTDGQYVRATFEQILDNTKDVTVYAKATDINNSASLEVFPLYEDELGNLTEGPSVAVFPSITEEGTYKILLTELQTPTDRFDLKVSGNIDIDLVIDPPVGWTGTGTINDPYLVNSCGTADASGYYQLSTNLTSSSGNCITISANNVTLSGTSTYSITNTSTGSDSGVYVGAFTGITIHDITITIANNGGSGRAIYNAGGTIDEIDAVIVNNDLGRAIFNTNSGIITNLNGSITNNSSGRGIRNTATISSIGATINNTADGYGIENLGTISEITASSTITNSGSGYGISGGSITINSILTITNSGTGYGIDSGGSMTINSILTINNTGGGIGFLNYYGTVNGSGTIIGDMTLESAGRLDLSTGLTLMGELTNNGGTVTENEIDCSTLGKADTSNILTDGTNYYGMCDIPLTEIVDRCGVINTTGTYTLNTNLTSSYGECINIIANDVTLSGASTYSITNTSDGFSDSGVSVYGSTGITIHDITITTNSRAISNYSGTIDEIDAVIINNGYGRAIHNTGTITNLNGSITNNSSGYGIRNLNGTISNIGATINNIADGIGIYNFAGVIGDITGTVTNTGSGSGILINMGSVDSISGSITNTGSGTGITNYVTISEITASSTITNSGSGHGIYNDSGTITTIDASIINTGTSTTASGILNLNSATITTISGDITNSGAGYGIYNDTSSVITTISGPVSSSKGSAIRNEGTIDSISSPITFTNIIWGYGIYNVGVNAYIGTISGPIINNSTGIYSVYNNYQAEIGEISSDFNIIGVGGEAIENEGEIGTISGHIVQNVSQSGWAAIYTYGGIIGEISADITVGDGNLAIYNDHNSVGAGIIDINSISGTIISDSTVLDDYSGLVTIYGAVGDISATIVNSGGAYTIYISDEYGEGNLNTLSGTIYNFSGATLTNNSRLGETTISGDIIDLPVSNGKIWTNADNDHDWNNPNNWLLGVPADTSSSTDAIILAADMILLSDIDNPIYFASDSITLYGDGYTVDNSIYGVDGTEEIGDNDATKGYDVNLVDVEWTGDITAGIGGSGSSNASANGGDITIDVTDLDLESKIINGGVSGTGGSANGTNGNISLTYQSLSTASTTYVYDAGTFTINGSLYEGINTSDSCANGISVGDPGCAWNGEFNPLIFYFTNSVDTNWNTLGNWWNDASYTIAASTLPFGYSQVIINGQISTSTSAVADTIVFNGTSTNSAEITVSRNATFNGSSINTGTITITNGTSTFYGDGTGTALGSIVGGFIQRIFNTNATTTRNFTNEGGRSDWFIKAIGNIIVDVFEATYDLASNSFQAILGAVFESERGNDSNSAGHPTPVITFDLGATNDDGDIIKWDPTIDWDTATTTGCIYSYDNFASTSTLDCSLDGADLPRPTGGSHTLYLRGIDGYGNITETAGYEYTYNNTYPVWTMCGDDLLDENRSYYYLTEDITGPCTITASSTTTILKGNISATSTGYTVTGNIVGNGNTINLQNITVDGYIDSVGGNITASDATITGSVSSFDGDITLSNGTFDGEIHSGGGSITVSNATTTDIISSGNGNGENAGTVTIATSTTGAIYANGANGTANGGNAGTITITNSIGTPISVIISAVGGDSLSCGNGGNGGLVSIINSTYGNITNIGGSSNTISCPSSSFTPGSSGPTVTVGNGYVPSSQSTSNSNQTQTVANNSSVSISGTIDSFFTKNIAPLLFDQIKKFDIFNSTKTTNIGNTIIPSPFKDFKAPTLLDFTTLPTKFLTNVSKFVLSKDNNLELFTVKSNNKSITVAIKYNKPANTVTQSISTQTNQKLDIKLNTKTETLKGSFDNQPIVFNKGNISITTPSIPGTYSLKADNSPVTLSIQVTESVNVEVEKVGKRTLWSWFKGLFR